MSTRDATGISDRVALQQTCAGGLQDQPSGSLRRHGAEAQTPRAVPTLPGLDVESIAPAQGPRPNHQSARPSRRGPRSRRQTLTGLSMPGGGETQAPPPRAIASSAGAGGAAGRGPRRIPPSRVKRGAGPRTRTSGAPRVVEGSRRAGTALPWISEAPCGQPCSVNRGRPLVLRRLHDRANRGFRSRAIALYAEVEGGRRGDSPRDPAHPSTREDEISPRITTNGPVRTLAIKCTSPKSARRLRTSSAFGVIYIRRPDQAQRTGAGTWPAAGALLNPRRMSWILLVNSARRRSRRCRLLACRDQLGLRSVRIDQGLSIPRALHRNSELVSNRARYGLVDRRRCRAACVRAVSGPGSDRLGGSRWPGSSNPGVKGRRNVPFAAARIAPPPGGRRRAASSRLALGVSGPARAGRHSPWVAKAPLRVCRSRRRDVPVMARPLISSPARSPAAC